MEKTENREIAAILNLIPKKAHQNNTTETCLRKTPQKSMFMKTERWEYQEFSLYMFYFCSFSWNWHASLTLIRERDRQKKTRCWKGMIRVCSSFLYVQGRSGLSWQVDDVKALTSWGKWNKKAVGYLRLVFLSNDSKPVSLVSFIQEPAPFLRW